MRFTPGPWIVGVIVPPNGCYSITDAEANSYIADVYAGHHSADIVNLEIGTANARLIAAAPELLAELQHLVRLLEPMEQYAMLNVPGLATLNGARAAIAKATGGT